MRSAVDSQPASPSFQLQELRQAVAVNHFKKAVLGARHQPGMPQWTEVKRAFSAIGMEEGLDQRTWEEWFGDPQRKARRDAVAKLDRYFDNKERRSPSAAWSLRAPRSTFYVDLTGTGLVKKLLRRTNAKRPIAALRKWAFEYGPTSASHLHLDAIECASLCFEGGEVACRELKAIAAERVLGLVYERWKPGRGSIYKELSSSLKIRWDRSDDQGKEAIRRSFARLIPDRFEVSMNETPSPDWIGVGANQDFASSDIHKALFLLAADADFLVADRFDVWVLDLVSVGIAAYALAQTDPEAWEPFGLSPTCRYWDAIRALFFSGEQNLDVEEHLERPFSLAGGEFTEDVERNLLAARASYWNWLASVGSSAQKISDLAGFESLYPKFFVGDRSTLRANSNLPTAPGI